MSHKELAFLVQFIVSGGIISYDDHSKEFTFQTVLENTDEVVGSNALFLPALRQAMRTCCAQL